MADDLLHAKFGAVVAGTAHRTKLMRNQGNTVYDVYTVHYTFILPDLLKTNEAAVIALSTRIEDQVDDFATVGFDVMTTEEQIWGVVPIIADLETEGGIGLVAAHTISFTKPYTVPWLAMIINTALAAAGNISADVWFVRRQVSAMDKASLVARLGGGRARTE